MYNKLFTKILDSSIWLAPDPHRLVWITLIAAMDEDGNAMFACVENLAARARVTVKHAEAAIKSFESPDPKSGDPENDGMRIERFPGGWHVLNAHKYRMLVTKTIIREQTRIRTRKWRDAKVTHRDAKVTQGDENVTPSEAVSEALSESESEEPRDVPQRTAELVSADKSKTAIKPPDTEAPEWRIFDHWRTTHGHQRAKLDQKRMKLLRAAIKLYDEATLCQSITGYLNSPHHMGTDPKGNATKYDDIELLLRDAKHIDQGLRFYEQGAPVPGLSATTKQTLAGMQEFLNRGNA